MCLCDTYIRVCVCVCFFNLTISDILEFVLKMHLWIFVCVLSVLSLNNGFRWPNHWEVIPLETPVRWLYPSCSLLHCCQNLWQHFSWPKAPHLLHSFFHLQCDSCLLSLSVSSSRSDRSGGKVAMATYPSMDCSLLPQTLWNTEKQKHMPRQNKLQ